MTGKNWSRLALNEDVQRNGNRLRTVQSGASASAHMTWSADSSAWNTRS